VYTVSATNSGGSATYDVTITVNDIAPAFSYATPNTYTIGTAIADLAPTNAGGTVVSYSVSPALPAGLSLNTATGEISGTPTTITANATYTITATNTGGSTTKAIDIKVVDVIPSGLTYSTPNTFTKGTAISALTPTVSGGAVESYSISPALPAGFNLNTATGEISGTPTAVTANAIYTVTASNSGGSASFDVTINVTNNGTTTIIAGDTDGDGIIDNGEIAGDTNGDGKIDNGEIAGDLNGDGKITSPELAGDTNGDGKIDNGEIAGDTNGDGKITSPELAGDTNGDNTINYSEILGDANGDGMIDNNEIAGDSNGDGKINNAEVDGTVITVSSLSTANNPVVGCENTTLDLPYSLLSGTPAQYKITFDAVALAVGFKNLTYTDLPSATASTVVFTIPEGIADGTYHGTMQLRNSVQESAPYPFEFKINLSSNYIIKKFDDVILCDNSSNRFTGYQWFKDGVAIEGATDQFYADPKGLVGSYSVELITIDGQKLNSCEKSFNSPVSKSVKAYPNPVKTNNDITVQMSGFDNSELKNAKLTLFDTNGNLIYRLDKVETVNSFNLISIPGVCIGHVTTITGKNYAFKVIVTK